MIGNLSIAEIDEVLSGEVIGRIGCHADGLTYVVPVSYAYNNNTIYIHSEEGMKISMMRKNPRVCFQTDSMKDMANWKSVIAWGEFEELTDTTERNKALEILFDRNLPIITSQTVHLSPQWPFRPADISSVKGIVYRIKIEQRSGRFEKSNGISPLAG